MSTRNKIIGISAIMLLLLTAFIAGQQSEKLKQQLNLFEAFFTTLNEHYVDTIDVEKLMRTSIDQTAKALDPYTRFFDAEETKKRGKDWAGIRYSGIGASIDNRNGKTFITYPVEGYGAWEKGLRAGDVFVKIDNLDVRDSSMAVIVNLLRGEAGTKVTVTVERPGDGAVTKDILRKEIKSPAVPFHGMVDSLTGYIKFSHFLSGSGHAFIGAFDELKNKKGCRSLIIDLRGNTGGLVNQAIRTLSVFLPQGTEVCILRGKHPDANYSYFTESIPHDTLMPLVLLIDQKTISAGEIFAGALQDLDRAVLIGQTTHGKGYVQGTRFPGFETSLYVTAARYYTPSGRCIQKMDYSKRYIKGTVSAFPDSLQQVFYTRNGREVYNIGGIKPDIFKKNSRERNHFIQALIKEYLIFDYATKYRSSRDSISSPEKFHLKENEVARFMAAVESEEQAIRIPSDDQLTKLKETAEADGSIHYMEEEYRQLENKLAESKAALAADNREGIKAALEKEIIRRYYFNSGIYKRSVQNDPQIISAVSIVQNKAKYESILNP